MRRKHLVSLLMLSIGVALLVAAMAAGGAMSATKAGGTLKVGTFGGLSFLDPQEAYDTGAWTVLENTQLLLVRYPDSNKSSTPLKLEGAASFPTVAPGGKMYTWHIRPGFHFNDGSAVTASSYKRAFERILSPCMYQGGIGTADFFDKTIVGGVAFNTDGGRQVANRCPGGVPHVKSISGIIASDSKKTLTIKLTHPAAYMTAAMAMIWFSAMKPNTPYDNDQTQGDNGASIAYPSAGPFYVSNVDNQGTVVAKLKTNTHYTPPAGALHRTSFASGIDILSYGSQHGCYVDTVAGSVDVDLCGMNAADAATAAGNYPPHTVSGAKGAAAGGSGRLHWEVTDCIDYITLDTQRAPTNNVKVRQALEYILDRTDTLSVLGPGAGTPSSQLLTPPIPGYKAYTAYPALPNWPKAKSIVGTALNGKTLNIWHSQSGTRTTQANHIKTQIDNFSQHYNLNINPNPMTIDSTTYYIQLGNKQVATHGSNAQPGFNLARAGWCADYYDPFDYLNVLFDGSAIQPAGNNDLSYLNVSSINKGLQHAATLVGSARKSAYASLDKQIMTTQAPVMSYELDYSRILVGPSVGNWQYDQFQGSPSLNVLSF